MAEQEIILYSGDSAIVVREDLSSEVYVSEEGEHPNDAALSILALAVGFNDDKIFRIMVAKMNTMRNEAKEDETQKIEPEEISSSEIKISSSEKE